MLARLMEATSKADSLRVLDEWGVPHLALRTLFRSLARARRLVGLKGYVTNIDAKMMPATEVLSSYHDLWHVEPSFRMSKSDLRARPVFHHTKDAIQAHLTVVFAALAVAWHLQHVTGHSIHTLRPLQQITLTIADHQHTAADPVTPAAKTILDALHIGTA